MKSGFECLKSIYISLNLKSCLNCEDSVFDNSPSWMLDQKTFILGIMWCEYEEEKIGWWWVILLESNANERWKVCLIGSRFTCTLQGANWTGPNSVRSRSGPGPNRSGLVRTEFGSVRSSVHSFAPIRSSVQAGPVRSWTDEHPYLECWGAQLSK